MSHALERTSPKGERFVGYCTKCGMHELPMIAATNPCPMDDVVSDDQALLAAINKPQPKPRFEPYGGAPAPAGCCDFAVVDHSIGQEVCRVWNENDARLISELLNTHKSEQPDAT